MYVKICQNIIYRKSSFKSPPGGGGLFIASSFDGGLIWEGAGGLINLEKTMVSALHKELGSKVEKLKYKKVGGHAAEDQNQIRTCSWYKTIPDQSINTVSFSSEE